MVEVQEITDDGRGVLQPEQNIQINVDIKPEPKRPPGFKNPVTRNVDKTILLDKADSSGRSYTKEEVKALIISYSEQYGINPNTPLCIAERESNDNPYSKNESSTASGVFQYLSNTWRGTDEGKSGLSVWEADANTRAAVKYMGTHKNVKPWTTAKFCPPLTFTNG